MEKKNFNYDAEIKFRKPNFVQRSLSIKEITNIAHLMPVKINFIDDSGCKKEIFAYVDYGAKKIYYQSPTVSIDNLEEMFFNSYGLPPAVTDFPDLTIPKDMINEVNRYKQEHNLANDITSFNEQEHNARREK